MYTCQCKSVKWGRAVVSVKGGGCISEVSFNRGFLCIFIPTSNPTSAYFQTYTQGRGFGCKVEPEW